MSTEPTDATPENADTTQLEQTIKDPALASAVLEIESHVAQEGWEQPARLYALVDTLRFIEAEPRMAAAMGLDTAAVPGSLTAVEQEQYGPERQIEEILAGIVWPETVDGCAVVLERLALPPEADAEMPEDPEARAEYARNHPQAQIVRMAAGATRNGSTYCALRLKAHDDDFAVVDGTEMVPELVELVLSTLQDGSPDENGGQQ